MPIDLQFYSNGVIIHESGIITDDEFIAAVEKIYDHDYEDGLQFQLADLSNVTDFRVSVDTMRDVGTRDLKESKALPTQHLVVVAPPASYTRLMNEVWAIWVKDHQQMPSVRTNLVDAFSEALEWLASRGVDIATQGRSSEADS